MPLYPEPLGPSARLLRCRKSRFLMQRTRSYLHSRRCEFFADVLQVLGSAQLRLCLATGARVVSEGQWFVRRLRQGLCAPAKAAHSYPRSAPRCLFDCCAWLRWSTFPRQVLVARHQRNDPVRQGRENTLPLLSSCRKNRQILRACMKMCRRTP